MKKKNYLTSALLVGGLLAGSLTAGATVRTVKLNTSKPVGTEITLQVNRTYAGVTVDWGDGQVETYKAESGEVIQITGTVKGSFITISGNEAWDMLACPNCGVEIIDLTNAKDMRSLFLQNNDLMTVPLQGMTKLVDFDASNNKLNKIEFTQSSYPEKDLLSIENFNVANNQLSGAFVIRANTLRSLDVSNNEFTAVYTSSNSSLDYLDVSHNQLKTLSLAGNPKLSTLICNDNALTNIIWPAGITTMQQLICDNNSLSTTFNLANCSSLSDVSIANNKISSIYLPGSSKTNSLNVSNNQLGLGALPLRAVRPTQLSFNPQAPVDISGYANVKKKDGVPYMPVVEWAKRRENGIDLTELRNIGVTSTSTGTTEGVVTWYAIENGEEKELVPGRTSAAMNDYFAQGAKYNFFTPHAKVFARIVANSVYKDDNISINTSVIAVGEDMTTGIGQVVNENGTLQIATSRGSLTLQSEHAISVTVRALNGKTVWAGTVNGVETISLQSGVYIVNGQKVVL